MAEQYRLYGRSYSTKLKQVITAISATKLYDYGTLLEDTVGNKYRYCKWGGSSVLTQRAGWGYNYQITGHDAIPTTSAIGTKTIAVTVGATDGIAGDGVIAVDYLADGYAIVWHADLTTMRLRIISNTVGASGGTMTITVEDPLNAAVTLATETIEIFASPFCDVRTGNSGGNHAFIAQPMAPFVTGSPYGWGLVHGVTFIDPQPAVGLTLAQQLVFRHDGSVDVQDDSDAFAQHMQHAGHVLSYLAAGTQAAPFMMLKIE